MGIRFLCPNGHKLNVKAFLAGERGICPQCDAKFLVPRESGCQAEAIAELAAAESDAVSGDASGEALHRDYEEPPPAPSLPPAAATETPATDEVWHVRMASGEQFGPANTEVMRGWIAEGRVPADCWVWRTGWAEWKPGGQAITFLNGPAPPAHLKPPTSEPTSAPVEIPTAPAADDLPTPTIATANYLNTKRTRQARARKVTFFLGGLVLLLIVILAVVLMD